jgi:uncharacterized protein YecT (DUF1311 family)
VRLAAASALLLSIAAEAQAPLPAECSGPTTAEIRLCLKARLAAAAENMERYLAAARTAARPSQKVDEVQDSWLAYRDSACRDAALRFEGGSLAPVLALECRLELTNARTLDIWRSYLIEENVLPKP